MAGPAAACSTPRWPEPAPRPSASTSPPALRLAWRNIRRVGPALIAGAIIIGIGILRIPLLEVLLVMLPASLAVTMLERAR